MFGKVVEVPQTRDARRSTPARPYGVAKVYGHWITVNYRESYDLHAIAASSSTTSRPRRGLEFVTRKITHGVAQIKLGLATELRLGNLDAQRDWGFAGDYVEAMWLMLQQDEPDDYVVVHRRDPLGARVLRAGLRPRRPRLRGATSCIDEQFFRPAEVDLLIGDSDEGPRRCSAGSPRRRSRSWCTMMVDADLALLSGQAPSRLS